MPGVESKADSSRALCVVPGSGNVVQPRQPTSLQGLLRFCMDATKAEDAPTESEFAPMDEERKKWLEEALKSMTMNIIQLLRKQIEILVKVDQLKEEDDVTEYESAVDIILEHIDDIDTACDFHKIGGFMVLYPCLKSPISIIRQAGCELLAVLCQNNPYCQEVVLDNEFIPMLLTMVEKDEDVKVSVKALYAASSIIRNNQEGFSQFIHYNGPVILLNALARGDDKLIRKATFLLNSLCDSQPDFKSRLVFLEYVPKLIDLVSTERQPSHEHALSLLATLIEENTTALSECRNPKYNLQQVLPKYIEECTDKPECMEEVQHCKRILYLVFGLN